jgi:hypothetical protein
MMLFQGRLQALTEHLIDQAASRERQIPQILASGACCCDPLPPTCASTSLALRRLGFFDPRPDKTVTAHFSAAALMECVRLRHSACPTTPAEDAFAVRFQPGLTRDV